MIPKKRIPTHPGQVLLEDFLIPMEIPQTQLADHLKVPLQRINELVNGKRGVTPETAWLLAAAFKTSPDFWMNLQAQHDLARNRPTSMLDAIRGFAASLPSTRRSGATGSASTRSKSRSSRRAS